MIEDKYTLSIDMLPSLGNLKCPITIVYHANGMCCEYVGDYCLWPKQEPRKFVISMGPSIIIVEDDRYKSYPGMMLNKAKPLIGKKFYQTLNNKYNRGRYATQKKG